MPTAPRPTYRRPRQQFGALYSALTLFSLHWALVLFINSSFLEQYVDESAIGLLYTTSSALTILVFLFISRVLHRVGNFKLTVFLTILELCALVGMATAETLRVAVPLFMLHQAVVPLILFNLDVYMERMVGGAEHQTGGRRGLFLMIMSISVAVAPLVSGLLVSDTHASFAPAYFASALLLLPFLFLIIRNFRTFSDPRYAEIKVLRTLRAFWMKRDIRNVFCAHFFLQLFFALMVIYTPLYLSTVIGFRWDEIGAILFVGFLAYVFLEYPIGIIADRHIGEKEMMVVGFIIMSLATASFAFLGTATTLMWMFAMFMSRVGASFVEATTESYFFKHTRGTDANIISFFRITRPLSYVLGALGASLALLYVPLDALFIMLSLFLIPPMFFAAKITDTK